MAWVCVGRMIRHVVPTPNQDRRQRAGEVIRAARERAGQTQTAAAQAISAALQKLVGPGESQTVGQSAVSRWEIGSVAPEPWKLPVIEDVLGIPTGTLASVLYDRPPQAPDQLEERLAAIESAMAEQSAALDRILDAITAADRRRRDQDS